MHQKESQLLLLQKLLQKELKRSERSVIKKVNLTHSLGNVVRVSEAEASQLETFGWKRGKK